MSGLLDLFVAPAEAAGARPRPRSAAAWDSGAPAAAVLGAPGDAPAVARLLASELRLRSRAGCAILAEWRPEGAEAPAPRGGVTPPATRRLASSLEARGLKAAAGGRLVRLALPADPEEAVAAWSRAVAAASCPAVCAVAGPRPPAFDGLLDALDLLVLVSPEPATPELTDLALSGLAALRPPVAVTAAPPPGAALLAGSSLATSRFLGPDLAALVRDLA